MPYSIFLSPNGEFIIIKVIGDITRKFSMQINVEAHKLGLELGINKYLVDLTQSKNVENAVENYKFAYEDMANTPEIDRFAVVAMLVSPDDHSHDFIETLAKNTGLNVTIFRNREEAVNHLQKKI